MAHIVWSKPAAVCHLRWRSVPISSIMLMARRLGCSAEPQTDYYFEIQVSAPAGVPRSVLNQTFGVLWHGIEL